MADDGAGGAAEQASGGGGWVLVARTVAAIGAAADLEGALRALIAGVAKLTGADTGGVRLLADPARLGGPALLFFWQGADVYAWSDVETLPGSNTARVMVTGQPEYTADLRAEAERGDEAAGIAYQHDGLCSSLIAPLRVSGRIIGTVHADSRRAQAFFAAQLEPLQVLADYAAGAIEQARLRTEGESARARLAAAEAAADAHRREMAEGVVRTLAAVGAATGPEAALEALVRGTMALLGGIAGVGRLFDPQTGECILRLRIRPEGTVERLAERHRLDRSLIGAVLAAGGAASIVEDFQAFDRQRYAAFDLVQAQALRSSVNVPIDVGGRRIGSLHVNHHLPRYFGPTDLALAGALAAHAGAVIERAHLIATEREQWRARQESEERLRLVALATNDAVWDWDVRADVVLWNAGIQTLFRYQLDQIPLTIRFWEENLHPADAARVLRDVHAVIDGGGDFWSAEYRFRRADGSFAAVYDRGYVIRASDGTPTRMVGAMLDISERKAAEEALARRYREAEEARGEARAILDATEEAMMLITPDGRVASVNRRFVELFGIGEGEVAGRRLDDVNERMSRLFSVNDGRLLAAYLAGQQMPGSWDLRQRRPVERDLALSCSAVSAADGRALGHLFAFRDVTRERALSRLKDEFVANVSHELRTPLTSIKGYADLLLAGDVGDLTLEQREFLNIIKSNADREVTLVNDLLDLSRLEAGKIDLTLAPVHLHLLVKGIAAAFRPQLEAKRQTLALDVPATLPAVLGDKNRLTQVFMNLVSNAYKYTPTGGRLAVVATADADSGRVRVAVTDSGIGMTPADVRQLFTTFFRAKSWAASEVGGTGLGLAITKSLVELHGGAITAESAPGKGSVFTVTLPAHTAVK